jgi:epoxyqueuosine reductase
MADEPEQHLSLEDRIKAGAASLGFALCGITSPSEPDNYEVFTRWLTTGNHASMAWLATDRSITIRKNPSLLLPGCQSIIIVASKYPLSNKPHNDRHGRIAGYALFKDYHKTLVDELSLLADFIHTQTDHPISWKAYTDTGPILERELASRAGLGWIGKNSCLISPQVGSAFLLAELLVSLPLQPDQPFLYDYCGKCQRCVDACPTHAILGDRTIDSRRCLSFWTIESKLPIPGEISARQSGWAFGCDICQQVCPWNQHQPQDEHSTLLGRPMDEFIDLDYVNNLTTEYFAERFGDTPVERSKAHGLRRNLTSLIPTSHSQDDSKQLQTLLFNDPHPLVRRQAARSLMMSKGIGAVEILTQSLTSEKDQETFKDLQILLGMLSG